MAKYWKYVLAKMLSCISYKGAGKPLSLWFYPLCLCNHELVSCPSHHHSCLPRPDGPWRNSHTPQLMTLCVFVPLCLSFLIKFLLVICWLFTWIFTLYLKNLHLNFDLLIIFIFLFFHPASKSNGPSSLWVWKYFDQ